MAVTMLLTLHRSMRPIKQQSPSIIVIIKDIIICLTLDITMGIIILSMGLLFNKTLLP
jgi:Zn-dependent membrane protease YugP